MNKHEELRLCSKRINFANAFKIGEGGGRGDQDGEHM